MNDDESWHHREMRLADERKQAWLDNRGRVVTWLFEPFPRPFWLVSAQAGVMAGFISGAFLALSIAG